MPAKRAIILDRLEPGRFRVALWADVPAARQQFYAKGGAVSAWTGASAAENTAIATGAVAERVQDIAASSGATVATLRTLIQQAWQAFQDEITQENPWNRYGAFWDGVTLTWTAGGVP